MFTINRYCYKDKGSGLKFEFYARNQETADEMARLITGLGVVNLIPKRFRFVQVMCTEIPPYELEQEQFNTIEGYYQHAKEQEDMQKSNVVSEDDENL